MRLVHFVICIYFTCIIYMYLFLYFVSVCVLCASVYTTHMPKHMYGDQKTTGGGWVSHSTMWAPTIQLTVQGLEGSSSSPTELACQPKLLQTLLLSLV